jgi:YcaO-like protein with predicted kinase domain
VPFECVDANFTLPFPQGSGCFQASSNGLGGGNHWLEAISHALCELVERDAYALWWLWDESARAARRIDLATVDDPDCRMVLNQYKSAGIAVAAWDMTTDVEIPSCVCIISSRSQAESEHLIAADGMGCHPSRNIALLRALTEAAQSRLTVIAGARDDLTRAAYLSARTRSHTAVLCDLAESQVPGRIFCSPEFVGSSLEQDVTWELERLHAAGFDEVLAIDLTRQEFGIPLVKLLIPGLEGVCFQPDYMPGERAQGVRGAIP